LGPIHWLVIIITLMIYGIPTALILKRAGYHPAWTLLAIIPGVALIGLWVFAFARWPALAKPDAFSPEQQELA
jgi:predicted PurR-regulated permease PerM